jgi:hypothetical protein
MTESAKPVSEPIPWSLICLAVRNWLRTYGRTLDRTFGNHCAGSVLELQPKAAETSQKRTAETLIVIGTCWFELLAAALDFALITQRSEASSRSLECRPSQSQAQARKVEVCFIRKRKQGAPRVQNNNFFARLRAPLRPVTR